jgi:collagenase-like PrtC family protease
MTTHIKLSLGPVIFYWPRETLFNFYAEIANLPIDCIYLGETVCSKRRSLNLDDWLDLAVILTKAGKQVVLSTLSLLEAESELLTLRRICSNGQFLVEANDFGAIQLLSSQKIPFVAGSTVNIYNTQALKLLASKGLSRWVFPVELSRANLAVMQQQRPTGVETEVLAYGHLPLAFSARCFTARSHNLPKDDCRLCCADYPEGRLLTTRDNAPFLTLNGIQTLSSRPINLLAELPDFINLGVEWLRISPQFTHTVDIINVFADCIAGNIDPHAATVELEKFAPLGVVSGYWHGKPGMERLI